MNDICVSSFINRLAALQKSGETEWKKRVAKPALPTGSPASAAEMSDDPSVNSDNDIPVTKSSIAERLKVLETAQMGWRLRVSEQDAARFTVAGKMGQQPRPISVHVLTTDNPTDSPAKSVSPLLERKTKKAPKPVPLRIKKPSEASESSSGTPSTDDVKPVFNRSTSEPNGNKPTQVTSKPSKSGPSVVACWFHLLTFSCQAQSSSKSGSIVKVSSRVVSVPRPDDETFTSFFASSSTLSVDMSMSSSFTDMSTEDFDHIAISRDL